MQSESVEELVKHYDEMADHGEKFKEHISTLQEVAKNIKVAQMKYKGSMTKSMPSHLSFTLDSLF